ncbi:hypothetical protein L596_017654 [Steinernema carpocapsae]|uniref:Uncharacterized protein n=1 Tax=Steinernema carpocapsae TaxID=34508 RepID=A0A4U5N2N7_STECR|nr:hypothetical protein L596_017654 [Steinernema carpocapsae]
MLIIIDLTDISFIILCLTRQDIAEKVEVIRVLPPSCGQKYAAVCSENTWQDEDGTNMALEAFFNSNMNQRNMTLYRAAGNVNVISVTS